MRNWWFYLGMFVSVTGMQVAIKSICGLDEFPSEAAIVLGIGSAVVASIAYLLGRLEERDKKEHE